MCAHSADESVSQNSAVLDIKLYVSKKSPSVQGFVGHSNHDIMTLYPPPQPLLKES